MGGRQAKPAGQTHITGMKAQFQSPDAARPRPAAPPGSRLYAIGDIHGRLDLLKRLLNLIRDDAARSTSPRKAVIYLGDYVDRGSDSKGVIDLLLSRPMKNAGFEEIHLMGNHEDVLLQFLADVRCGPDWFAYGGLETLASYGVRPPRFSTAADDLDRAQREFAERIPQDHLEFIRGMKLSHEEGGYVFVHAGVRPGVALADQTGQDLMWIREEFLESNADFGKLVVHGHTITDAPQVAANRIGIDTGAFYSGKLTALALEGVERAFIQT
jgi:serine/threonine protein phosphatase 1